MSHTLVNLADKYGGAMEMEGISQWQVLEMGKRPRGNHGGNSHRGNYVGNKPSMGEKSSGKVT